MINARCDAAGTLVAADEPLARLQQACGGAIPGPIAILSLAQFVARGRAVGRTIGGSIMAHDGEHTIRAWAEMSPCGDPPGVDGWDIVLCDWRNAEADDDDAGFSAALALDQTLAALSARLDGEQRVLAATAHGPALGALETAMMQRPKQPWTDFVSLSGNAHRQPLHWRLLDGAELRIAGAGRGWRARLVPIDPHDLAAGFDLYLLSADPVPPGPAAPIEQGAGLGTEIAPALRQPLARIIANAETIQSALAGPLAEEYRHYAGDIATAGAHLRGLVEDLADLDALDTDSVAVVAEPIDLADIARRACGILGVRAQAREVALLAPEEGAHAPAWGDFRRALQILLNLVGNAIAYGPVGGRVVIACGVAGGQAQAHVEDEGPGLTATQSAAIFDKFERLGRSGDGGSGLGLYISRGLARAMGGDLTVTSTPGKGARFTLSLPLGAATPA